MTTQKLLSNKTKRAIKNYGIKSCIDSFKDYELRGDGASTMAISFEQETGIKCTTRQMDSRIDAGRELTNKNQKL